MHGHVYANSNPIWAGGLPDPEANLRSYLYSGVTTVFDPGDGSSDAFERRDRVARGELVGPHIYTAGPIHTAPEGHPIALVREFAPWWIGWYLAPRVAVAVDSRGGGERGDRPRRGAAARRGEDRDRRDSARRAAHAARGGARDRRARAQPRLAHGGARRDDPRRDHRGGVGRRDVDARRLQGAHPRPRYRDPGRLSHPDGRRRSRCSTAMRGCARDRARRLRSSARPCRPRCSTPSIRCPTVSTRARSTSWQDLNEQAMPYRTENVRRLHAAGVAIFAGSDTQSGVFPGPGLHRELANLARAGLTPIEVIRAATIGPARFLAGRDEPDWGNVAVGQRADLLLVEGDPTRDVAALSAIRAVLLDGVPIARTPVENPPELTALVGCTGRADVRRSGVGSGSPHGCGLLRAVCYARACAFIAHASATKASAQPSRSGVLSTPVAEDRRATCACMSLHARRLTGGLHRSVRGVRPGRPTIRVGVVLRLST